jgi:hypothetical protein
VATPGDGGYLRKKAEGSILRYHSGSASCATFVCGQIYIGKPAHLMPCQETVAGN